LDLEAAMLKSVALVLVIALAPVALAQTITVSDLGAQVPVGNVSQGQVDYIPLIFGMVKLGSTAPSNFTGCTIANIAGANPAGSSDTVQIRLIHDLNRNGHVDTTDTVVMTQSSPGFPVVLSGFSQPVPVPTPALVAPYLVTVDAAATATLGNIYRLELQSITVSAGSTTGTPITGNNHTIIAPTNAEMHVERGGVAMPSGAIDTVGDRQDGVQFSLTYTIFNTGFDPLSLTGSPRVLIPAATVQNCSATVSTQPPAQVVAGTNSAFIVDVTPFSSGGSVISFGMLIVNDDSDESQYTIAVSGTISASGGAVALIITTQPAGAVAATSFSTQPEIEVRDAASAVVTGFSGNVTATILTNPAGGTLSGTQTVTIVNGVATFTNLSINNAGVGYELRFSSAGLTPADTNLFNVNPPAGPATQLAIVTQPGGAAPGTAFTSQPVVEIRDSVGALAASDNTTQVTATITTGTGTVGAILGGTVTRTAVNGVVTFTDLSIDLAGSGYTLDFSDSGVLTDDTSSTFNVSTGGGGGADGGGGDGGGGGCSTSEVPNAWWLPIVVLALFSLTLRTRRRC
jgi:hypothetical protein